MRVSFDPGLVEDAVFLASQGDEERVDRELEMAYSGHLGGRHG